jgi:hypothetical protein
VFKHDGSKLSPADPHVPCKRRGLTSQKKQYLAKKEKLIQLLKETHLTISDVEFDERKQGTDECDLDSIACKLY